MAKRIFFRKLFSVKININIMSVSTALLCIVESVALAWAWLSYVN